jgi:hypothetical protein
LKAISQIQERSSRSTHTLGLKVRLTQGWDCSDTKPNVAERRSPLSGLSRIANLMRLSADEQAEVENAATLLVAKKR